MRAIILTICLLLQLTCGAASYYVATNGSDSNPGSLASPFLTVSKAVRTTTLNPGDTVYIRGGTYNGYANEIDLPVGVQNNGTSNSPITVQAYSGERPVITGIDGTSFHYYALILKQKQWWKFDGLCYSNNYGHGYFDSISNCVFTNCVFTAMPTNGWDTSTSAFPAVWMFGTSQLNKFYNCEFSWWGDVGETNQQYKAHGAAISLGNETTDDQTWYNLFDGCRFNNCGHDLTTISSAYNIFRNGFYHNEAWYPTNSYVYQLYNGGSARYQSNPYGKWSARIMKPGDAGDYMIDQRNVWENNSFLYAGPPPDSGGAFGIELATHKSIYRNNVIAFALAAGIYINTSGSTTQVRSNVIYNNTVFGNGLSWVYGGDWMQSYSRGIDLNTFEYRMTNNMLVNNIFWQNYPSNVHGNVITMNQWRTNWSGDYSGLTYPKFISTNGFGWQYNSNNLPNFRLQGDSPVIDKGAFLATITSASGSGSTVVLDNSLYFSDGNRVTTGDAIQLQGATSPSAIILSNDITNNTLTLDRSITWTNGQGVSLPFSGSAPDFGAFEYTSGPTLLVLTEPVARGYLGSQFDDWVYQIRREGVWTNVQVIECPRFAGSYSSNSWPQLSYMSNAVRRFNPSAVQIVGRLPGLRTGGFSPDGHNTRCSWDYSWLGCTNLTFTDSTAWGMAGSTVMEANVAGDGTPDELTGSFSIPVAVIDFSGMATNSNIGTFASGYLSGQGACRAVDESDALKRYFTNNLSYRRQSWTNSLTGLVFSSIGVASQVQSSNSFLSWTSTGNQTNFAGQNAKMVYEQLSLSEFSPDYVDGSGNWARVFWSVGSKSYNWEGYEGTGVDNGVKFPQRRLANGFSSYPVSLVYTWGKHNISPPRWFVGSSDVTVADAIRTSASAQSGTISFDISNVFGDLTLQIPRYTQAPPGRATVATLTIAH